MRAASRKGSRKTDFLADKRTQQAVIMSLIIIGKASTKVMDGFAVHPDPPRSAVARSARAALG